MFNTPILLITFNRPSHTKKTIEALRVQKPPLVYVFQDGPREHRDEDIKMCKLVRDVIMSDINWDCELYTYFSEKNRGCRDAIIYAITEVLNKHESVIVVEDDIITSPAFYSYMTKALKYYRDRKTVFSISGYSHSPEKIQVPKDYDYDVFTSPRLFNWGWGTWKDRWEQTDWSMSYYDRLIQHPYECLAFNRGGDDMMEMLKDEYEGKSSAWDIQFAFAHFYNHAVSIVPCISYTHNIGMDGSGTHCNNVKSHKTSIQLLNSNDCPIFLDTLYFDARIINTLYSMYTKKRRPLWQKFINTLFKIAGGNPPYLLKKKIYL